MSDPLQALIRGLDKCAVCKHERRYGDPCTVAVGDSICGCLQFLTPEEKREATKLARLLRSA